MATATTTGTHFFLITLEIPGRAALTRSGTFTPEPGETRNDAYAAIREHLNRQDPDFTHANVSFFSIEPNTL
jgi:hypothetical protein